MGKEVSNNMQSQLHKKHTESLQEMEKQNVDLTNELASKDLDLAVVSTSLAAYEDERRILDSEVKRLENCVVDSIRAKESYDFTIAEIHVERKQQQKMWDEQEQKLLKRMKCLEN